MTSHQTRMEMYPVAIFEDRYTGAYSGGKWIAVAGCDDHFQRTTRFQFAFDGTHDSDPGAADFGALIPEIRFIAVGDTPQEAYDNLEKKIAKRMKTNVSDEVEI